jgi:hypothetical protein
MVCRALKALAVFALVSPVRWTGAAGAAEHVRGPALQREVDGPRRHRNEPPHLGRDLQGYLTPVRSGPGQTDRQTDRPERMGPRALLQDAGGAEGSAFKPCPEGCEERGTCNLEEGRCE